MGTYTMASSGSAFCTCVEAQYYTDPWSDPTILVTGPPTINSGGVAAYPNGGSGPISSVEPGTTGQLAIYGTFLTAGGQDLTPKVTATNGVNITGLTSIQDGQLNASYDATNATAGTASVTVQTNVGITSPPGQIAVGDLTPVIQTISSTSYTVGAPQNVTLGGHNFGSACPQITFPFLVPAYTTSSCSDESVTVAFTPSGAGTGTLGLSSPGYGGKGFDPQTNPPDTGKGNSPTVSSTIQFQILGSPFIFVGHDPAVVSANLYQSSSPSKGTLSATSSDAKDVISAVAGPPPGVEFTTADQSSSDLDRKLTFTYTVPGGGGSASQTMNVTSRLFFWATNNSPTNVCALPYGTDRTYTYTVFTHPDGGAVDSDSHLSGTTTSETFTPALTSGQITGGGSLDVNGEFTDHVSSLCSSQPLPCSNQSVQTLSVGGIPGAEEYPRVDIQGRYIHEQRTNTMKRLLLFAGASALFSAFSFGQTWRLAKEQTPASSNPHIADEVEQYELSDETLLEGLSKLSLDKHVSLHIGIEEALRARIADPVDRSVRFSLALKHKAVRDVLDALCAADPRYAWSLDEGSINVYPIARVNDATDLLNFRIERLDVNNISNPDQALTALSKAFPDEQIGYFHNGPDNDYPEPWTFAFEHLTVRQFINRVSERMGSRSSWIWQGGADGRAFNFVKGGFSRQR